MSAETHPIPPHLFAAAIQDLPLGNVYGKAAELQNSISHLLASNVQMQPFAREGDEVCQEAIEENDAVIARMRARIQLCRAEVERRGGAWSAHAVGADAVPEPGEEERGGREGEGVNGHLESRHTASSGTDAPSAGRLTDEELRRQLEARMRGDAEDGEDEGEDGVHL